MSAIMETMRRRAHVRSMGAMIVALGLSWLWNYEHEHTSIRAPWTGTTLFLAALAVVVAGYVGWKVWGMFWAALIGAGAVGLSALLSPGEEPDPASCDPGCIMVEFAIVMASATAALLAVIGVLIRIGVQTWRGRRGGQPA